MALYNACVFIGLLILMAATSYWFYVLLPLYIVVYALGAWVYRWLGIGVFTALPARLRPRATRRFVTRTSTVVGVVIFAVYVTLFVRWTMSQS